MKKRKRRIITAKNSKINKIAGIGDKSVNIIDKAINAVTSIPDKIDAAIDKAI